MFVLSQYNLCSYVQSIIYVHTFKIKYMFIRSKYNLCSYVQSIIYECVALFNYITEQVSKGDDN